MNSTKYGVIFKYSAVKKQLFNRKGTAIKHYPHRDEYVND